MAAAASVYPPLNQRPVKNTVLLFDVDDTLTKPRQVSCPGLLKSSKVVDLSHESVGFSMASFIQDSFSLLE